MLHTENNCILIGAPPTDLPALLFPLMLNRIPGAKRLSYLRSTFGIGLSDVFMFS